MDEIMKNVWLDLLELIFFTTKLPMALLDQTLKKP